MAANRRFVRATGLHQFWGLFSPPRTEVLEWWARVTFADGGTEIWRLPERDPFIGSLNDYHWQKFMEHAALRGNTDEWPRLWEPLARYVAREVERPGRRPVSVTLVTRRTLNLPIGSDGPDRAEPRVDEYFTLDLDEAGE